MKVYDNLVRAGLAELADASYQERVWSGRDNEAMSSFIEFVETLFDDSGLGDALDRGVVYSVAVDEDLRALRSVLSRIDGRQAFEQLASDHRLVQCRNLAAQILRELPDTEDGVPA